MGRGPSSSGRTTLEVRTEAPVYTILTALRSAFDAVALQSPYKGGESRTPARGQSKCERELRGAVTSGRGPRFRSAGVVLINP